MKALAARGPEALEPLELWQLAALTEQHEDAEAALALFRAYQARPVFREVWRSGEAVSAVAARVLGPESLEPGGVAARLLPLTSGVHGLPLVYAGFALSLFSVLGVLILAFMVGLQSSISEMRRLRSTSGRWGTTRSHPTRYRATRPRC